MSLEYDQADARLGQKNEGTDPLETLEVSNQTDLSHRYVQIR